METNDAPVGFGRLGLIANPFDASGDESLDSLGVKLAKRNASHALVAAMQSASDGPGSRPILVEKSADVPPMYTVAALATALGALSNGVLGDVLQLYVPLDMMRIGRLRAVLHVLAERIAGAGADRTIAAWAAQALAEPDTSLAEWSALETTCDIEALRMRLASDPTAFVAEVFGEPVESRAGAEDLEVLMRVSHARLERLDADPDERPADASEVDSDDPMGEAFVTPLGDVDDRVLPESGTAGDDELVAYLLAVARTASPVLARGLAAYRAQGTNSMAEELKITKAPSKTLPALMRFARARYSAAYVIIDRFDLFDVAPASLKTDIAASLELMRSALAGLATFVFLIEPGEAPEVEASLVDSARVSWRFEELVRVESREAPFEPQAADAWVAAVSLGGVPAWWPPLRAAIPAGTTAEAGFSALGAAVDVARAENREPSSDDVTLALAAMAE